MSNPRLSDETVAQFLADLPGWQVSANQLNRRFEFPDFSAAMGFMVRVAMVCETMDHHPNWYNVYGKVEVQLWTHDAGGITALDIRLATQMSKIAAGLEVASAG